MRVSSNSRDSDFITKVAGDRASSSSSSSSSIQPTSSFSSEATERDALLDSRQKSSYDSNVAVLPTTTEGIRERRSSQSPSNSNRNSQEVGKHPESNGSGHMAMGRGTSAQSSYERKHPPSTLSATSSARSEDPAFHYPADPNPSENDNASYSASIRSNRSNRSLRSIRSVRSNRSTVSNGNDGIHAQYNDRSQAVFGESNDKQLLEIPKEIYVVRRAALTVLEPLTHTWLIMTAGLTATVAFGTARYANILPNMSYFDILIPMWLSHCGLFICHIMSARALKTFIYNSNESRQRPDSTDHLDRTEYLPLLQRSLKFGLKTGLLSFALFIFEILLYRWLEYSRISLAAALSPLWVLVMGGMLDGIICKTQSFLRLCAWVSFSTFLVLSVMKFDHHMELDWKFIISPLIVLLLLLFSALFYIVKGHRIGYFRLTESQLTASILYSMGVISSILAALIFLQLHIMNRIDKLNRILFVALSPLAVALFGLGAWAISRDEFEKLLQDGGQAAVHPKKLRLEPNGWTCVESKGVTLIPLFGEVSYVPLRSRNGESNGFCCCFECYPSEDNEDLSSDGIPYIPSITSNASDRNII